MRKLFNGFAITIFLIVPFFLTASDGGDKGKVPQQAVLLHYISQLGDACKQVREKSALKDSAWSSYTIVDQKHKGYLGFFYRGSLNSAWQELGKAHTALARAKCSQSQLGSELRDFLSQKGCSYDESWEIQRSIEKGAGVENVLTQFEGRMANQPFYKRWGWVKR